MTKFRGIRFLIIFCKFAKDFWRVLLSAHGEVTKITSYQVSPCNACFIDITSRTDYDALLLVWNAHNLISLNLLVIWSLFKLANE